MPAQLIYGFHLHQLQMLDASLGSVPYFKKFCTKVAEFNFSKQYARVLNDNRNWNEINQIKSPFKRIYVLWTFLPIWQTEACLSFFHLFFKLLDTVEEGHHSMVEFIIPEKAQPTGAI